MNGNPFFVQPGGDLRQGLAGLGQTFQQIGARNREEESVKRAAEKFARIKTEAMAAYQSGDPNQIAQFNINNPEMAEAMNLTELASHRDEETLNNSLDSSYSFLANPTRDNAVKLVSQRKKLLISKGVPPEQQAETDSFLQRFDEDPEKLIKETEGRLAAVDTERFVKYRESIGKPVTGGDELPNTDISRFANLEIEKWNNANPEAVARGEKPPPQVIQDAMQRIKRPGADESYDVRLAQLEANKELRPLIESLIATQTTGAKGKESRAQSVINQGIESAEALPVLKRGIELLETVKTGGWRAISLKVRSKLGIEGADEGELNNSLGKAVLSQLRETFGAAFTFGEGQSLKDLEAEFGKSNETNLRLLKRALRSSEHKISRARRRAKARGDEETVSELDALMEFSLAPVEDTLEGGQQFTEGQTATGPGGVKMIFNNGNWEAM
jgi:hypothetical protein